MNWHICYKRKLLFVFVFSTYLPVFLMKFRLRELVGCIIWFASNKYSHCILLIDPSTPKTINTWKNVMMMSSSSFFQVFLVLGVVGFIKSMPSGYSLDAEFDYVSKEYPHCIRFMDPATPKAINTWKNVMMMSSSCFFQIFIVFGVAR